MKILEYNDLNTSDLQGKYKKTVAFIEKGDFYSAQVKKLANKNYYAARLDITNRLLFKIVNYKNKKHALMLEIIRNHNYNDSRFLNGANVIEENIKKDDIESNVEEIKFINNNTESFHFLNKAVSFDDQQSAIYNERLPLILIGSAGSGKTLLSLEKLKTLRGNILYVSLSSYLVNNARKIYFSNNYQNSNQEIDFLSFDEFVSTIKVPEGKCMNFDHFKLWIQRYNLKKLSADKIYEEFKGTLTGVNTTKEHLNKEDYVNLGVRESLFTNDNKEKIYSLFLKYLELLKKDFYDHNIISFRYLDLIKKKYDYVVIDEVQDLTNIQIKLLLNSLSSEENFILCGDSNQIVHPNFFSWSKVKSLFYDGLNVNRKEILFLLKKNYRNSVNIVSVANDILKIKQSQFGSIDKESNYLIDSLYDKAGNICFLNKKEKELKKLNSSTRRSTKFAIIVLNENMKKEAKKYFENPLLFTIQEAKGLEYQNIILFNLVSCESKKYEEISAEITKEDLKKELKYSRGKDKEDKSMEIYKFYINAFYVAVTRAIENLYIIEEKSNNRFLELLDFYQYSGNEEVEENEAESDIEAWQKEASDLEKQGKLEQAENIKKEILREKQIPWGITTNSNYELLRDDVLQGKVTKEEKIKLFEYCLIYYKQRDIWKLRELNVKAANNLKKSYKIIKDKYFSQYRKNNYQNITDNTKLYGLNYKNQFNQTPAMVAAKLCNLELLEELVRKGADLETTDNNKLNCLQNFFLTIIGIVEDNKVNEERLYSIFTLLSDQCSVIKINDHLVKLDPKTMEFFLYNTIVGMLVSNFGLVSNDKVNSFNAKMLSGVFSKFPNSILKPHRKKQSYISAMLSKNEKNRNDLYNRKLFLRITRGVYILNPEIEIKKSDEWIRLSKELGEINK